MSGDIAVSVQKPKSRKLILSVLAGLAVMITLCGALAFWRYSVRRAAVNKYIANLLMRVDVPASHLIDDYYYWRDNVEPNATVEERIAAHQKYWSEWGKLQAELSRLEPPPDCQKMHAAQQEWLQLQRRSFELLDGYALTNDEHYRIESNQAVEDAFEYHDVFFSEWNRLTALYHLSAWPIDFSAAGADMK